MKRFLLLALTAGLLSTNVNACDFETDDVVVFAKDEMLVLCEAEVYDEEVEVFCWD